MVLRPKHPEDVGITEIRRYGNTEIRNARRAELRIYGKTEISKVKFSTCVVGVENRYNFAEREDLGPALKSRELGRRLAAMKSHGNRRTKKQ